MGPPHLEKQAQMYAKLLPAVIALSGLWACGGDSVTSECQTSAECAGDLVCVANACVPRAGTDAGPSADGGADAGVDAAADAGTTDSGDQTDASPTDSGDTDAMVMMDGGQPDAMPRDGGESPVRITFPPRGSITPADRVTVRGVSAAGANISALSINGVSASSNDGFATFSAEVPLSPGATALDVDIDSQTYFLGEVMRQDVLLLAPRDIERVNRNLYIVDSAYRQLVLLNVDTGARRVISGEGTGGGPLFDDPRGVVVNAAETTAYVVQTDSGTVFSVNLSTGDRTLLSGDTAGTGPTLSAPRRLVLDATGQRLLLVDSGLDALVAVSLATGDRTVISDDTTGMGPPMASPRDVAMDTTRGRVLVADSSASALFAINLSNGDRTVLQGQGAFFAEPRGVVVSNDNSTAYVADGEISTLFAVDLGTGDRTVIADSTIGLGPWIDPRRVLIGDPGHVWVLDYITDAIVDVELSTGHRSVTAWSSAGTGPHMGGPWGIAVHPTRWNEPVLVTDNFYERVYALDLSIGQRRVLSDLVSAGPNLDQPYGITWDVQGNRALLVDAVLDALIGLNVTDGARTMLSNDVTGAGPTLNAPRDVAVASDGTIYVVDSGADALFSVDRVTGDRTEVSGGAVGSGPAFDAPWALAFAGNGVMTVADSGLNAVIDTTLATGARAARPEGMPGYVTPRGAAYGANNTLYVSDETLRAIIQVDAAGARTVLADRATGRGPHLSAPAGIVMHADGFLLVVDSNDAVFAIDPATGDRVMASK